MRLCQDRCHYGIASLLNSKIMKRLKIIIFCFITVFTMSAQNYMAEYLSEKNICRMIFNTSTWRYEYNSNFKVSIEVNNTELDDESTSYSKPLSTFNFRSLDKNYYLDEEILVSPKEKYIVKGELIKPEWTILSDSVKIIENYTCLMAKGHVRGRDYTVWFTPDIPVSAGPWKLWGLPGLIVSAASDDGVVKEITMISLKQTDLAPVDPLVEKTITPKEYRVLYQEAMNKFIRKIRSLSEGSSVVDANIISFNPPDKSLFE